MKRGEFLGICAILLAWAGVAGGETLYVGGGGAYATIQAAIDAAETGDEIEVAPGTYSGPGDESEDSGFIDFKGKAVRLYSRDGAAVTTIDGSRYQHAVRCISGEASDTVLEGFTITLGGWGEYPSGGGMYNEDSSPTVTDCLFIKNHAYYSGGAMFNYRGSPLINRCTFQDNITYMGGGAMNNYLSSPVLLDCVFSTNDSGYYGGAMYNADADPVLINCLFYNNSAPFDGAGLYNHLSNPTIINCTFADNVIHVPGENGGGAMYNWDSSPTVVNCILWGNSGDQITGDPGTVTYSDVQGGRPGVGNIDADPLFVDAAGRDYRLRPDSPCIDAGTNSPPVGLPDSDLEGNPRIVDGNGDGAALVDMGAFEASQADVEQLLRSLMQDLDAIGLPKGIGNSLRAKLDCALKIVTDGNEANDSAAGAALRCFIQEVRAQRCKTIPATTADTLIGGAQEIITLLASQ